MEVLLWESELTQKPEEHLITFKAEQDDLAWVSDEEQEYIFQNGEWIKGNDNNVTNN